MWRTLRHYGIGCAILGFGTPLLAQAPRSGGGENQQIVAQYQQLAAEKTALQAQVDSLKHDLDAAKAELVTTKKDRDALKARTATVGANIGELTARRDAAQKSAEQTKQQLNVLVSRFRDTANELKQIETDRDRLQGELHVRSDAYDKCAADNLSLYELNGEILKRYEHVGLFTRVTADEPFTRITRNRLDNLVDEYRQRALELRAKSAASADEKGGSKPASVP